MIEEEELTDEEEWEKFLSGLLWKNPYWGAGFSTIWDASWALLAGFVLENEEMFKNKAENVMSKIGQIKYGRPQIAPILEDVMIKMLPFPEELKKNADLKTLLRNAGRHVWGEIYDIYF